MIVCYARLRVDPRVREEFVESCTRYQAASAAEAGCVFFHYSVDLLDPDLFYANELWETQDHLDAHERTEHYLVRRAEISGMGVQAELVTIVESGRVIEHAPR
jgi:quinol monooxygenase YgiN